MKLIHYSANGNLGPVKGRRQYRYTQEVRAKHPRLPIGKPRGFWVSVEGNEDGWADWCRGENFRLEELVYEYEVKLKPDARILYLSTQEELRDFTKKYYDPDGIMNKVSQEVHAENDFGFPASVHDIDWPAVARKYQGIIIAPYIYSCRLSPPTDWYYTWDCASGCIWNARAIESVKPTGKTNPIPKDYKPFDIVEWRTNMKKIAKDLKIELPSEKKEAKNG